MSALQNYMRLVPYLGQALGSHCEVALLDCRKGIITAIANGHISGRQVGAPLTDLAIRIIKEEHWRSSDYLANYTGLTMNGKILRSSTFFIREENTLVGMLCINMDISAYEEISELALSLAGLPALTAPSHEVHETFYDNMNHTIHQVLHELYGMDIPERFTQSERLRVLTQLNERGIFLIKGSIPTVAQILGCSESSLYRYLAKLQA